MSTALRWTSRKKKQILPSAEIRRLEAQVNKAKLLQERLELSNERLRDKASMLLVSITGLGDGLHFLAKALEFTQEQCNNDNVDVWDGVAEALATDLEVHELLQQALRQGGGLRVPGALQTTASMHTGVTVERVQEMQQQLQAGAPAFVAGMAQKLSALTFKMCFLLSHPATAASFLHSSSLESVGQAYMDEVLLMFCVDPVLLTRMSVLNLDTAQEEMAPDGLWDEVAECMELTRQQKVQLATAFQADEAKVAALHPRIVELAAAVKSVIDPSGTADEERSSSPAPAGTLQQSRDNNSSSNLSTDVKPWQRFCLQTSMTEENLELLESLLDELLSCMRQCRVLRHNGVFLWMNIPNRTQLCRATLRAYPFFPRPLAIISSIVKQLQREPAASSRSAAGDVALGHPWEFNKKTG